MPHLQLNYTSKPSLKVLILSETVDFKFLEVKEFWVQFSQNRCFCIVPFFSLFQTSKFWDVRMYRRQEEIKSTENRVLDCYLASNLSFLKIKNSAPKHTITNRYRVMITISSSLLDLMHCSIIHTFSYVKNKFINFA